MNIQKFSDLWEEKYKWFLQPIGEGTDYCIVGHNDRGEVVQVEIEDDDKYKAVIQKMIEEGVKILNPDEVAEFYKDAVSLPEGIPDRETAYKMLLPLLKQNPHLNPDLDESDEDE